MTLGPNPTAHLAGVERFTVSNCSTGRHRAPGRHNPIAELGVVASRAGQTGAKASAVLAASGGLVAAFALPATATPAEPAPQAGAARTAGVAAAPVLAPAAVAPATTPVRPATFGIVGITAVAKPKPAPVPRPVRATPERSVEPSARTSAREQRASRSSARAARSTTRAATAARRAATTPPARASLAPAASGVVAIARGLLGIPYVYGGTTPAGFDCSGFTSYVFRQAGISLPRTASAQKAASTPVSNPRPGDLVFFGSPVHHVGIYTGNGMMIDSPRTGKSTAERPIWTSNVAYGRP
jgi:cell wall-associated NlpC family hydrolase